MPRSAQGETGAHTITMGITDLMTSLAVIFILLLTAIINKEYYKVQNQAEDIKENVKKKLTDHFKKFKLDLKDDPSDPLVLLVVVPEDLLEFKFDEAVLEPKAKTFLRNAMPNFARALCGPLRQNIDSVIIEGHTDDIGTEEHNLKLSQNRSFNVMSRAVKEIKTMQTTYYDNKCFQEMTSASGRGKQDLIPDTQYDIPDRKKSRREFVPDRRKSRRVIFKIRIKSAEQRRTQAIKSSLKN